MQNNDNQRNVMPLQIVLLPIGIVVPLKSKRVL